MTPILSSVGVSGNPGAVHRTVLTILLAWVTTLPIAAVMATAVYWVLRRV